MTPFEIAKALGWLDLDYPEGEEYGKMYAYFKRTQDLDAFIELCAEFRDPDEALPVPVTNHSSSVYYATWYGLTS